MLEDDKIQPTDEAANRLYASNNSLFKGLDSQQSFVEELELPSTDEREERKHRGYGQLCKPIIVFCLLVYSAIAYVALLIQHHFI